MPLSATRPSAIKKRVTILGATGSIGRNTVDLVQRHPDRFDVVALTAQSNAQSLAELAHSLRPQFVAIGEDEQYSALKDALSGTNIRVGAGKQALVEAASIEAEIVVSAIVGAAGLEPTLAAIRQGRTVALANKECLVCAGDILRMEAKASGAMILPVDSEHSALFQVFDFTQSDRVETLTLTASGGPFLKLSVDEMAGVTPAQAVKHPNWAMGAKISVDSATLMNKGLELIEAYHLFPVRKDQLATVIHPESVIHGMVHYVDGSVLAQMSSPDMRTPIAYALGYPERIAAPSPRLDFARLGQLTFETPDETRFPALRLAREALLAGGTAPCILNAANEVAVQAFLSGKLGFLDIARMVERALDTIPSTGELSLEAVQQADRETRARLTA